MITKLGYLHSALLEAYTATTPGTWEADHDTFACDGGGDWSIQSDGKTIAQLEHDDDSPNTEFIVSVHRAMPTILDVLELVQKMQKSASEGEDLNKFSLDLLAIGPNRITG